MENADAPGEHGQGSGDAVMIMTKKRVAELERRAVHAEMGLAIDAVCGYFSSPPKENE